MDDWNSDIMLNVIQFLNVRDCSKLSQTASRYFYLTRQFQKLIGPQLVAATSHDPAIKTRQKTPAEVCQEAISKIQTTPNLALAFSKGSGSFSTSHLPDDIVAMETVAESIQCPELITTLTLDCSQGGVVDQFLAHLATTDDWKVFIINVAGSVTGAGVFVTKLQARFPEATIVGGVCDHGAVSVPVGASTKEDLGKQTTSSLVKLYRSLGGTTKFTGCMKDEVVEIIYNLQQSKKFRLARIDEGIFGIALTGQVPFRSVVSRGVRSLIHGGVPQSATTYYIEAADVVHHDDDANMFERETPSYHLIRSVRNQEDGKLYTPINLMQKFGLADMVGIRRESHDGFEVLPPHQVSFRINEILLFCDGQLLDEQSLVGANFDLFQLQAEACCLDLESKMKLLEEQTVGEQILGALMISCNGRGPSPGSFIPEEMADARRFANVFPNVPCLGYYANGEIGPMALAGRRSIFQTGSACVQGFTAVFALFIVPPVDLGAFELDDSAENVHLFVKSELHGSK
ncbi:hypothetical protein MPSEU_000778400 [Mayamaea pseudoterrestris]|nr:hypothetical protein MPSEU_000778400 [Mayamaea pseudoterrestris]